MPVRESSCVLRHSSRVLDANIFVLLVFQIDVVVHRHDDDPVCELFRYTVHLAMLCALKNFRLEHHWFSSKPM